ncbi:MAG: chitobiase/beta-hexosaminidase C-terminal domain-containing protein [Clostridiales Family XIII bacterium]|nr:chitobiase/beta-hexosaminidase C-terminal domain-containing protein [Clostridiales Family XIII bacterium]
MSDKSVRNRGGRPGREYTPEERRAIERRRRVERERRRRRNRSAVAVLVVFAVGIAVLCAWYFGSVKPNDNYDAQMIIGAESFHAGKYRKAEDAFMKALAKRPNDPDAMVAMSDTYAAEKRYEDAIRGMKALQGIDDTDTRAYERIIEWSVEGTKDMATANDQIAAAYGKQLALNSELIRPAPTFDPSPGDYEESTDISMNADPGLTIYYSADGSVPTPQDGEEYKKKISLKNNREVVYTAASYDEHGLMSWPSSAKYSLHVKYGVDAPAAQYLGLSAAVIMYDVGPLYYKAHDEKGYQYHDESEKCYYIFSGEDFMIEKTATDGAVEMSAMDPETEPLPPGARCVAISMKAGDYIIGMDGDINAYDFMTGISVKEYDIDRSEADSKYHLIYEDASARYDITLNDKETITVKSVLVVYAK